MLYRCSKCDNRVYGPDGRMFYCHRHVFKTVMSPAAVCFDCGPYALLVVPEDLTWVVTG